MSFIILLSVACSSSPGVFDYPTDTQTVCEAGTQICNGPILNICLPDESAYHKITCDLGCENGLCLSSPKCPPNTSQCIDGRLLRQCNEGGTSSHTVCDQACMNGECVSQICAPGAHFCSGDLLKVLECASDGLTQSEIEVCQFNCDPVNGQCKQKNCEIGQKTCGGDNGLSIQICSAGQTGFEPTGETCTPPNSCDQGECIPTFCKPYTKKCGESGIIECLASGAGYVPIESCEFGCLESSAGDALCALCEPGKLRCEGAEIQYCELPFQPWQTLKTCKEIDTCLDAQCLNMVTLSPENTSDKNRLLLTAALADCWLVMATETGPEQEVCRTINTLGLSVDIPKDDLASWFCDGYDSGTINADNLGSQSHLEAADDIMGCGLTNLMDLTVDTIGKKITGGLYQGECIGYEPNEILVKPCQDF
ncbi:MAG TPA: hypothetical protein EYN66_16410 [Myxococcales bacterium]|nr:hypothetical protein [Myxococcales bacterium]